MIWPELKRWPDTTSICRKCTLNYSPCAVVTHIHNKKSDHTFFCCCYDCCWARHSNCCVNVDACSVLFSGFGDRAVGYLVETGLLTWIYLFIYFFSPYKYKWYVRNRIAISLCLFSFFVRCHSHSHSQCLYCYVRILQRELAGTSIFLMLCALVFFSLSRCYSEIWNESLEWFFPGEIIKKIMHTKLLPCYRNLLPE